MKISTEDFLAHARNSLANAGGDVRDNHHADWLLQESIAYSLIAIGLELKRSNDSADLEREAFQERLDKHASRFDDDRKTKKTTIDEDIRRGLSSFEEKFIGS